VFAAQFALSHACWLVTYPVAGWLGVKAGLPVTFATLAIVAALAIMLAMRLWPAEDPDEIEHTHPASDTSHPPVQGAVRAGDRIRHRHAYVIDTHHPEWPGNG
jgi:hypothetical protein